MGLRDRRDEEIVGRHCIPYKLALKSLLKALGVSVLVEFYKGLMLRTEPDNSILLPPCFRFVSEKTKQYDCFEF